MRLLSESVTCETHTVKYKQVLYVRSTSLASAHSTNQTPGAASVL